jgi:hypothetical protein
MFFANEDDSRCKKMAAIQRQKRTLQRKTGLTTA